LQESTADRALSEEDRARAQCYALVSRLFYAPPDAQLLQELAGEAERGPQEEPAPTLETLETDATSNAYATAFRRLQGACRTADPDALRQEYDDLFGGAGRAVVSPYTSGYAAPHAPERHLLALREHLMTCGLGRRHSVFELEDHVSAVCDVMRWLIERERPLDEQVGFFNEFVYRGVGDFCDAIRVRATTDFYRAVASMTRAYIEIEKAAFDMQGPE
jgi:TorA maturation chaperone TorD